MARKSLLTMTQCEKIRSLKDQGSRAVDLAKKFRVSESSLYKVLDGSYTARPDEPGATPSIIPTKDMGATPSLFEHRLDRRVATMRPTIAQVLEKAAALDPVEIDAVTLAAAEVICAKARLKSALEHTH